MNLHVSSGRTPDMVMTMVLAFCLIALVSPLRARCDPAWDWACEQVDDCRRQVFGDPESWRLHKMPPSIISSVGVELDTDGFLDTRLLVGVSMESVPFVEILVAEGAPVFDQLVSLRRQFPKSEAQEIFRKVKVTQAALGQNELMELRDRIGSLKLIKVPIVLDRRQWVLHVHGLNTKIFIGPGIGDYLFTLNLPRPEDPTPPSDVLDAWAWDLARWLDKKIGLTVHSVPPAVMRD